MKTSHVTGLGVAVILALAGCTVIAGQPAPTATPLGWSELQSLVERAVAATEADWEQRPNDNPPDACERVESDYSEQSMIPESSGTRVVWRGRLPATERQGEARKILRERFERPWNDLGLETRYEGPGPLFDGGRVVATIPGSQQLRLSGALAEGFLSLDVRAACYTEGLPAQ